MADPRALRTRADALRREGRTAQAIAAYRDAADRLAQDGRLIEAIGIAKAILELDPAHVETQAALADLYATGDGPPGADGPLARPSSAARPAPPAGLPRVPIFSDLSPAAFVALTRAMVLRRAVAGEAVLREGEGGRSFFVVAAGRLSVSRRDERGDAVALAHLGPGEFFGEMALLTGAPRAATVVADESCELLEVSAEALSEVARAHPQVAASIRRFHRRRLLANAMATTPVFRPFEQDERNRIVARFRPREVADGEKVICEGEPSDGLYVVLEGVLDVVKRKGAGEVAVGRLRAGDVFGEMSCLRKVPASATVVARGGCSLLGLPRAEFDELVLSHPQILERIAELSDERGETLDAILTGHAQWTDDGLVLI